MASPDQPTAPYLDAVVAYGFRGATRFHVPGHKAGNGADLGVRTAFGWQAHRLDIPQDIHGVDLGPSPTPYERAEQLAAEAYGAARSWFLTNGATQGNHAVCLALAPLGAPVVVQRNCHASVIDGLVLSGGLPTWVAPQYEPVLGMAHGVTPESLKAALEATPGARAAFIVSPTYYGMAADVEGCAEVAHAAGVPLVVDQSWGPHLGFHEELPASALALGADVMLTSVHKIAGSLTQSALLHVSDSGRVNPDAIARTLRLVRSTSPSSLLMASLDGARRQLVLHGEALLGATIAASRRTCTAIDEIPGCRVVGDEQIGRPGRGGPRPAADRDRRPRDRRDRLRDGRFAALELRHAGGARHAGDDRARARHRRAAARARALHPRPHVDRAPDGAAGRDRGGHARHGDVRERGRGARRATRSWARPR